MKVLNPTPGPWYIAEKQLWLTTVRFIRTQHDTSGVVGLTNDNDAPLVSAAPDLLSALEDLLHAIYEGSLGLEEELTQAENAIAKARGRQP